MDANLRVRQLRELLHSASYAYYVRADSAFTDADYDRLYQELVALETRYPELIDPDSPTQRIGAPVTDAAPVRHSVRMLSLENTFTAAELLAYLGTGTTVCLEPKIDGCSLKLFYRKGRFVQAITRGDGNEGEDVTTAAKTIKTIPLRLTEPLDLTVVGEVYMRYTVFNELNAQLEAQGEPLFANPRNAATGSLKLKQPKEVAARKLSFVAYGLITELTGVTSQTLVTDKLALLGFQNVRWLPKTGTDLCVSSRLTFTTVEALERQIAAADDARKFLDLPTDGLVFKVDSLVKQRELGEGTKYPKYACCFKFPPERKATELLEITLQVGRSGKITPVAELKPVYLSGTIVRRASLCNADEIARLGLGIGDDVLVEKSAEIIPKVMGVAKKKVPGVYHLPMSCPCCKAKLYRPKDYVDWYCPNQDCADQVLARLKHACGKSALDIDGCGEALIMELMRHGVRSLYDLLTVEHLDYLKPAARQKLITGREKAKQAPYWRKLHALGVDGLGVNYCQDIAARWSCLGEAVETAYWTPDDLAMRNAEGADTTTLQALIGESCTRELVNWLEQHFAEVEQLSAIGFEMRRVGGSAGVLSGKVFCITGAHSVPREKLQDLIVAAGGTVKGSVTKAVTYLVAGSDAGATKTEAARKRGVNVIDEDQLYEMMGEARVAATTE